MLMATRQDREIASARERERETERGGEVRLGGGVDSSRLGDDGSYCGAQPAGLPSSPSRSR